jgi:hypothetical protein
VTNRVKAVSRIRFVSQTYFLDTEFWNLIEALKLRGHLRITLLQVVMLCYDHIIVQSDQCIATNLIMRVASTNYFEQNINSYSIIHTYNI